MRNTIFYVALLLQLLIEMLPFLSGVTTYISTFLFLIYLVGTGIRMNNAYMKWITIVFLFFALSSLWALNWKISLWKLLFGLLPIYLATASTYSFLLQSPKNMKKILAIFMVAASFLMVFLMFNLGEITEGERIGHIINENTGMEDDETNKFNSNTIGIDLCYTLFAGYILLFKNNKKLLRRIVLLVIAIPIVSLIFLTGSRKALFLLLLPFIIHPMLNTSKKKMLLIIPLVIGLVAVVFSMIMYIPALYDVIGVRIVDMANILSGDTTGSEDISRLILVTYGIEWFMQNPVLGYGINNFRVLSNQTLEFGGLNIYAHNNYIELLVGVGIIGFFIYYSCYFYFWGRMRKHVAGNSTNLWIVVLIINSLFLDLAEVSYYSFLENMILCICFYAAERTTKTEEMKLKVNKNETSRHYPAM